MNKQVVFCGGGNMAEGILRELIAKDIVASDNITVSEINPTRCDYLSNTYKVTATTNAEDAFKSADVIIIAVTPNFVATVAESIKPLINNDTLVLSIAAGTTIESIANVLGTDKKIVRIMPNTLGQSGNGYSAICPNQLCNSEDIDTATSIISALGQVMPLKENMFNTFTAFSNVGPLWVYKMIEALIDAGVYVGFSRQDSRNIVIKNIIGAATILEQSDVHPAVKVDQMTSPGGITIEALRVLQDDGFASALMDSVVAAFDKLNKE